MRFIPSSGLLASPRGRQLAAAGIGEQRPQSTPIPTACRVAIIGCGPAALSLVTNLYHRWGDLRDVVLLDRDGIPLGRFFTRVDALEQSILRSPYEHHVGTHEHRDCELLDFARCRWVALTDIERGEVRMAMSGQRSVVPIDVFRAYVYHTVFNHDVAAHCWKSDVEQVEQSGGRWVVHHTGGSLTAERVVFAIGERTIEVPRAWQASDRVVPWDRYRSGSAASTAVVSGSGLSAAHVVADLCTRGGEVTWVQRRAERFQCADVNARYFRPEGRGMFRSLPHDLRTRSLVRSRVPTIMFEFQPLLRGWQENGCLSVYRHTSISGVRELADGRLSVLLSNGTTRVVDQAVAAHGTTPTPLPVEGLSSYLPNMPLVDDDTLEPVGRPGLHVMGAHAAMSIGPAARNIDGMRVAAQQIAAAFDRAEGRSL